MRLGFIGYGAMATALAGRYASSHDIFIGGRDVARAKELASSIGRGAGGGSSLRAVRHAEVVFLATPHDEVFNAIDEIGPPTFAERIVVDMNNPVSPKDDDYVPSQYSGVSLAESIQRRLRSSSVVKAFNMAPANVWRRPQLSFDGRPLRSMLCGDDQDANDAVGALLRELGADPLDVGELRYARSLEASAGLVIKLLSEGAAPMTTLNVVD